MRDGFAGSSSIQQGAGPSCLSMTETAEQMERLDFESDTVTRPSSEMRRAMAEAEVGDDVLDHNPTLERLEARVAELLGLEAAPLGPLRLLGNL